VEIKFEEKDGVAVMRVSGRMVFDLNLFLLRTQVRTALEAGTRRFVIDISEAPFIDSSGCGELISVYTSITNAGGLLALVKPSPRVRTLLERIKLTKILMIFETYKEAEAFVRL
jgi:anti-sigma B factor antagonist